jgi:hypothetical protein
MFRNKIPETLPSRISITGWPLDERAKSEDTTPFNVLLYLEI